MGTKMSETGVKATFLEADGKTPRRDRSNLFGEYAFFFSIPRPIAHGNPDPLFGSQDWLTDVIIVDNPIKLTELRPSQTQTAATSFCTPQVCIQWDVGNGQYEKGVEERSLTICLGDRSGNNHFFVEEILILPQGTQMDKNHCLFDKWVKGASRLLNATR